MTIRRNYTLQLYTRCYMSNVKHAYAIIKQRIVAPGDVLLQRIVVPNEIKFARICEFFQNQDLLVDGKDHDEFKGMVTVPEIWLNRLRPVQVAKFACKTFPEEQ